MEEEEIDYDAIIQAERQTSTRKEEEEDECKFDVYWR